MACQMYLLHQCAPGPADDVSIPPCASYALHTGFKDVQVLLGQSLLMWINALSQHTVLALFSKSDRCM